MRTKKFYVISYDIVDDKKRTRVADTLKDFGSRVQKSVFECRLEAKVLKKVLQKLKSIIDKETDNIVIYTLCEGCVKQKNYLGLKILGEAEAEEYHIL